MNSGPTRSIDGIARPARRTSPQSARRTGHTAKPPPTVRQQPSTRPKRLAVPVLFVIVVLVLGSIVGCSFAGYQFVAEVIIIIYGIGAIVRRIPSQLTFILALIMLALTPIAAIAGFGNQAISFSSYIFLFLMFGTICLGVELSRD